MLPEAVWNIPPMGSVNLHGSLLPQYRGAAPINWAVINGGETGVTTFKLKHEIDTGDILLQERFPIGDDETAGEVHDKMKAIGAQLLVRTVQDLADGTLRKCPNYPPAACLPDRQARNPADRPETLKTPEDLYRNLPHRFFQNGERSAQPGQGLAFSRRIHQPRRQNTEDIPHGKTTGYNKISKRFFRNR